MNLNEVLEHAYFKDEDLETPPPIITIGGKTIATPGNFIILQGAPKAAKLLSLFSL